jgi:hypothetical protein
MTLGLGKRKNKGRKLSMCDIYLSKVDMNPKTPKELTEPELQLSFEFLTILFGY